MMTLLVDHREHDMMKKLVKDYIGKYAPDANDRISLDKIGNLQIASHVKFVQLEVGDYADPEHGFGVERKSDDLWSEIDSGNLFAKLHELSQYPHSYLIIDQSIEEIKRGIMRRVFMKNNLTSAQKNAEYKRRMMRLSGAIASCCIRGFPPVFCTNKNEAAQLIVRLYYKARDSKDRTEVSATRPTATHKDRAMRVLLSYPNIGDKTAEKLLEHCGTVDEVNKLLTKLFNKPNKLLMRKLGLNQRQLDGAIVVLYGDAK